MNMKVLTRDDILNADDMVIESCPAPEWGGMFYVKRLSETERSAWEKSNWVKKKGKDEINMMEARRKLFVKVACDEKGNLLFQLVDLERLGQKSAAPIDRGCDIARRLSGITKEDEEEIANGDQSENAASATA